MTRPRTSRHSAPILCLLIWALTLPGASLTQQGPGDRASTAEVTIGAVTKSGRAVNDLRADELQVAVDGQMAPILAIDGPEEAGDWQIVIYFDGVLTRTSSIQRLADALSRQAAGFVDLGEVEIVVADPAPRTILPPTRDLQFVEDALNRLFLRGSGSNALRAHRSTYLEQRRRPDRGATDAATHTLDALTQEIDTLRRQQDELLAWLARSGHGGSRRLMVLLNEGLGLDPVDFYLELEPGAPQIAMKASEVPAAAEVAEALAAFGWTAVGANLYINEESDKNLQPLSTPQAPVGFQPLSPPQAPVGFRLRFDRGKQPEPEDEVEEEQLRLEPSVAPLREIAAVTGGLVLTEAEQVEALVLGIAERITLHYGAAASRATALRLDVRSTRSDVEVLAPTLQTGYNPESVAAVRVRRALEGEFDDGDLGVESTLRFDPRQIGRSEAVLLTEADLDDVIDGEGSTTPVRVTVGVHLEDGDLLVRHELATARATADSELWSHESSLILPSGTDAAAVVVEHLDSGEWGVSLTDFYDLVRTPDIDVESDDRPTGADRSIQAIRLVPSDSRVQRGKVTFKTEVVPEVERVDFLLNGKRVATRNKPPFEARIDLGKSNRLSQVVAIAFDRTGTELDRDGLLINEPAESFWVRIASPRPSHKVGPVDVEANLKLPQGGQLDRLEFYWRDRLAGTVVAPPYNHRVRIPVDEQDGYLRIAAILTDGRLAEDVVLMNRPGFGARIGVELVELYVVATDRSGQPVRDLKRDDFVVLEDRSPQEIETFARAGNLPLTVGLAMDSSSSLFIKMPAVQKAAQDFVRGLMVDRDRAFLVGFGSRPRVVREMTGDLRDILIGIDSLSPFGTTPVWEAIVLSLTQLESVSGRKALVVFYDGDDEDEDFAYSAALAMARDTTVPIYMIVMNNAAARSGGRSFSERSFVGRLEKIARAGGGRVYYVSTSQDLGEIFTAISDELRSHYLLTYYPKDPAGGPQWRPVEVEITEHGMTARTIEGYGQRQ